MTKSALEVVTLYNLEVWNKGRLDLIPELCADRIVRHDANSVTILNLDEQIARITHNFNELRPTFEPVVLAGDDRFVTLVWNVTGRDPNWKWCGIEVFRVENGKIVEVWNSPYVDGRWSREGALWVRQDGLDPVPLPFMSVDLHSTKASLLVPLDAHGIATWLALAFGKPESEQIGTTLWRHHYTTRSSRPDFALFHAEVGNPAHSLNAASLTRLDIRWARSGLVNVTIDLTGTAGAAVAAPTSGFVETVRLAECTGQFTGLSGMTARVAGASIGLNGVDGRASGEITLRMPMEQRPEAVCGTGLVEFGWRHDFHSLGFAGHAELSNPSGAFVDRNECEAVFQWSTDTITATLLTDRES